MTNTKFRKRALLSSVAMLLVALVALGSATFAWFTQSTTATASGLAISTTRSSELKVAKVDFDFKDAVVYDDEASSYVPATSTTGSTWYTSVASEKTAFTSNGTYSSGISGGKSDLSGIVYKEMLNIKNTGGKTATGVKIDISGTFASKFGRLAVVPCSTAQSTENEFPSIQATDFKANIYGSAASDSWKPYNGTSVESTAWGLKGAANGASITVGNIDAGSVKSYMILVWFEGEDSDCYDLTTSDLKIGGSSATNNLKFTVSSAS